ncbi:N-acetylmuramoyl-L-alanine amidase [Georgenia phoenicis]|uniref:N-acetylmuramoyl-L-alanine amidase n=1 Tax=unclassified Georgenia TaxID=2626815 RepID=UPI0039AF1301
MTRGRTALCCTIVGLLAAGALAPAAQGVEEPGGRDVAVLSLSDSTGAASELAIPVADPTAGTAVVTEELDVPEFAVAGITWSGQEQPEEEISIRVLTDGSWTPWTPLEADDAGTGGGGGTEPYVAGRATGAQVRVSGGDGVLPPDLQLHLIPAEPSEQQQVATTPDDVAALGATAASATSARATATTTAAAPAATAAAAPAGAPAVIPRARWGADESLMTWQPEYDPLQAAVIHHTAGTNSYTRAESAGIVRGIYHYHAVSRGWGDIGYNFLVDKYGQVFEGRTGSLAAPYGLIPEGGHARSFNPGTLGISVLGDYSTVRAPDIALTRMAEVIAWKFADAGINVRSASGFVSPGTWARPKGQQLPRIFAHRDVQDTTCPGDNIYARIPALTNDVERKVAALGGRTSTFHLRNRASGGPADTVFALGRAMDSVLVGDWDGDGRDTIALRRGNRYEFYNTLGSGAPDAVVGYGKPTDVVLVGDWNGDGVDTLAVRRGREYHVKNSISGGPADVVIAYGRERDNILVGDWDGNGTDSFTVRRGKEYHVKNSMAGGKADRVFAYGHTSDIVLVGNWNGRGGDTLTVRRGRTYYVSNTLTGGQANVVFDYGRPGDSVITGDWDGDGVDGLGIRRLG